MFGVRDVWVGVCGEMIIVCFSSSSMLHFSMSFHSTLRIVLIVFSRAESLVSKSVEVVWLEVGLVGVVP